MKLKTFLLILLLFLPNLINAQYNQVKGIHPYDLEQNKNGVKTEIAHWSIIPYIGFNSFDGDFTSEKKHSIGFPTVGLGVEYNFTPVWNVGIKYTYDMYNVSGKHGHANTLLNGHLHKAGAYLSMDLVSLCFRHSKKKIVSVLPYIGGGAAFYKRSKYHMDDYYVDPKTGIEINSTHKKGNTSGYINSDGDNAPDYDTKYSSMGYLQAGVNVEFNLNRTLALGINADYSYFTRDYADGRGYHKYSPSSFASKNNDGIFDIALNMRIKLEAVSKSHPRNMTSLKNINKINNQRNIGRDTIIIKHDSIIIRETNTVIETNIQPRIFNVYFDNDKDNIKQHEYGTLHEIAMYMNNDTSLYAVIIGYCDNTGTKSYNYDLGDRRANNVYVELIEEFEIPVDHIYNNGVGKIAARKTNGSFGPNRRVTIYLVNKETFNDMKTKLKDKNTNRNVNDNEPVLYDKSNTFLILKNK